jgi:hypothetical protein
VSIVDARKARLLIGGAVGLLLALLPAGPADGATAAQATSISPGPQVSLDEVLEALHVEATPADMVVLVDTSKSMRSGGSYRNVRSALRPLLAALPPGDHLSLLTFDATPTLRFSGQVGRSPGSVLDRLPPQPNGQFTDIGSAIDAALRELQRPGASRTGVLVLITDGRHQPPPGSAFPPTGNSAAWTALRRRADRLAEERLLAAYALALGPDTDAALLKRAFPDTLVLALPSGQLGRYLQGVQVRIRLDKARSLLTGERDAVDVHWPTKPLDLASATTDVEVVLSSTARHVPLELTDLALRSSGGMDVRAAGLPARLLLRPGERRTVTLRLSRSRASGFAVVRRSLHRRANLQLTASVLTPWSQVLAGDLGLALRPSLRGDAVEAQASDTVGVGYPLLALTVLAACLLSLTAARFVVAVRRPSLRGSLTVVPPGLPPQRLKLTGRKVRLGQRPGTRLPIPGIGAIRGRRIRDRRHRRRDVDLLISYSASAGGRRRHRAVCPPNSTAVVDGTTFSYQAR